MHNDPEKFVFDIKQSNLAVNKNKSHGGFKKRLLGKGFRSTFCHCVNGSTCGDLVPPSLCSRQRVWDGLLWPLGYLTDGAVPSPAPNLHSVHRNDSLKSDRQRGRPALVQCLFSSHLPPLLCLGPFVKFSLFLLMWNFNASPFEWLDVIVIVEQREMCFELEAVFHFCFYI